MRSGGFVLKTSEPIASVIIPVKNGQDYLEESLISVMHQVTNHPYQIIVINDNSTDSTDLIILKLLKIDPRIVYKKSTGSGIVDALNLGVSISTGQYLIRHDADDLMQPWRIQIQVNFLAQNPDVAIMGGQIQIFGITEGIKPNIYPEKDADIRRLMDRGNAFAHPTVAINRKYLTLNPYDKKFEGAEDYKLWVDLLQKGLGYNSILTMTKYRVHERQVTFSQKNKIDLATIKVQKHILMNNLYRRKLVRVFRICLYVTARYIRIIYRDINGL